MSSGALWIAAGLALAGLDMLAPGVFLLWIGLAALGTGLAAELARAAGPFPLAWHSQLALFTVLTAALIGLVALRLRYAPRRDTLNAPAAGLIGQTCSALAFQHGEGRVSLGDGTWSARTTDGDTPAPGQALRVIGLEGTTLVVTSRT